MKTKKRPVDLVVFDVGNVLLRWSTDRARRNFDRAEAGAGDRLAPLLWGHDLGRRFEKGLLDGRAFFAKVKRKLGLSMKYKDFEDSLNEIFDPMRENMSILKHLSKKHRTGLLSNTNEVHWRFVFRRYPDLRHAHHPVGSHELRSLKPEPRIFRRFARLTRTPLESMAFFDDVPENVAAAKRLGIRARLFDGKTPLRKLLGGLGVL